MKRTLQVCSLVLLVGTVLSCSSSPLDDTEAPVFLSMEVEEYNPDIDVCLYFTGGTDLTISALTIESHAKDPSGALTSHQDVYLTRWVVTPERVDGGTTASPQWTHDLSVYVPAGGNAGLENYRVYPSEYLDDPPLGYLLPENGGVDPETGERVIRQTLYLQVYGRTASGKAISTPRLPIAFKFECN
jgi:hypothetical protein